MQNNIAVVSFIDVIRQVDDGLEEHYVDITKITPPEIHPVEAGRPNVFTPMVSRCLHVHITLKKVMIGELGEGTREEVH